MTAMDMHMFMMGWYKKFPTFKKRELFLTGESYAGKNVTNEFILIGVCYSFIHISVSTVN